MKLFLLFIGLVLLNPSLTSAGNYHTSLVHDQEFGVLSEPCTESIISVANFWDSHYGFDGIKINTYQEGKPGTRGVRIRSYCDIVYDEKKYPVRAIVSLLFFAEDGVRTGRDFFKVDLMTNKVTKTR